MRDKKEMENEQRNEDLEAITEGVDEKELGELEVRGDLSLLEGGK